MFHYLWYISPNVVCLYGVRDTKPPPCTHLFILDHIYVGLIGEEISDQRCFIQSVSWCEFTSHKSEDKQNKF